MNAPLLNHALKAREHPCPKRAGKPGLSLLEMTVVLLVLMALLTVLWVGAKAWKRGSDRAMCIIHISNVQRGIRSFSNLHGYGPGDTVSGLVGNIIGMGRFVEKSPACPSDGSYTYGQDFGPDVIPPTGDLYLECSLAGSSEHEPSEHSEW